MNEEGWYHGVGTYYHRDGEADVGRFENGDDVGEGVRWSADRKTAWRLEDGEVVGLRRVEGHLRRARLFPPRER